MRLAHAGAMTRAVVLALLIAGCATWGSPPKGTLPHPPEHERAMTVIGSVYGVDFLAFRNGGTRPLDFRYIVPTCMRGSDIHGYVTSKGSCVTGALAQGGVVNAAWAPGMRHSESGWCEALWQAKEAIEGNGLPDVYTTPPEETAGIAACRAALKEAGH